MEARVTQEFRFKTIRALGGCEFTKNEWRPVPVEKETEAEQTMFLEVRASEPSESKETGKARGRMK